MDNVSAALSSVALPCHSGCSTVTSAAIASSNESGLEDVVSKLQDKYVVYVTQVSIDERIAQQCRELKQKYNDLDKLQVSYAGIASIKQVCSYEQRASILRTTIQGK